MAQSLIIRNHCDVCLGQDTPAETPADTYSVAVSVMAPDEHTEAATPARAEDNPRPFVVELCPQHGAALAEAVLALVPYGRTPNAGKARRQRADQTPGAGVVACPRCGHTAPTLAGLRPHVRAEHGTSLAGVGLVPANFKCETCGDPFPNRQGLAAHIRVNHPDIKQTA